MNHSVKLRLTLKEMIDPFYRASFVRLHFIIIIISVLLYLHLNIFFKFVIYFQVDAK